MTNIKYIFFLSFAYIMFSCVSAYPNPFSTGNGIGSRSNNPFASDDNNRNNRSGIEYPDISNLFDGISKDKFYVPYKHIKNEKIITVINSYNLENPYNFDKAIRSFKMQLSKSNELLKKGERQIVSEDYTMWNGERKSRANIRRKGKKNISSAKRKIEEIKFKIRFVKKLKNEFDQINNKYPLIDNIMFKDNRGREFNGSILFLHEGYLYISKNNSNTYFRIGSGKLSPDIFRDQKSKIYDALTKIRFVNEVKTDKIGKAYFICSDKNKNYFITIDKKLIFIDSSDSDNNIFEQYINDKEFEIKNLERAISNSKQHIKSIKDNRNEFKRSFIIISKKDRSKFEALHELGNFVYEVEIEDFRALLVTNKTQYVSSGVGNLEIKYHQFVNVETTSGELRLFPVFVEIADIDRDAKLSQAKENLSLLKDKHDKLVDKLSKVNDYHKRNLIIYEYFAELFATNEIKELDISKYRIFKQ